MAHKELQAVIDRSTLLARGQKKNDHPPGSLRDGRGNGSASDSLEIVPFCWHNRGLDMTKTELQVALAAATETDKRTAGLFLDTLSNLAYKEIKKNGEFVLPGFGKLVKQKRKARTGINPKTMQKIKIPAKTVVKLRVAKAAKDSVLGVKK
jgi:DNA-binding protein HU-beta